MGLDKSGQAKSFEELAAMESIEETKETSAEAVAEVTDPADEATEKVTAEADTGGVTEEVIDNTTEETPA